MNWLVTRGGDSVGLEDDLRLLGAVLKLDEAHGDLAAAGADDVATALERLEAGDDRVRGLLRRLGIDAEELNGLLERFTNALGDQLPDELQFLTRTFAELQADAGARRAYVWPVIDQSEEAARGVLPEVTLALGVKASASLGIQALAAPPPGVGGDAAKPVLLRIGAAGELSARAGAAAPAGAVALGAGAQAATSAAMEFHFRHAMGKRVGEALLADLPRLRSPFDVADLEALLYRGNLAAIHATASHLLGFDGRLDFALAADFAAGGAVTGGAGAGFGFSLTESGEFEYLVRRADDGCNLAVGLKRVVADAREYRRSLQVGVDLSGWAGKVYPMIRGRIGKARALIARVESLIPGQPGFQELVGGALGEALAGFPLLEPVRSRLGLAAEDDLSAALLRRVEDSAAIWQPRAASAARDLAADLLARLPLGTELKNELQGRIESGLQAGLERLDQALQERVKAMVKGRGYAEVREVLASLGTRLPESLRRVEERAAAVLGPVRRELASLQKRLSDLAANFEDAAKAKVLLRFEALSREENARGLDLEVVLDPAAEGAQAVLDQLLTGRLSALLERGEGGAVRRIRGRRERYGRLLDKQGFNAVLFGFGFSGTTVLDARSRILVDPQGNVQVLSRLEWEQVYGRPGEDRRLAIVNAYELASARRTGSLTLAMDLSLEDGDLEPGEVQAFLGSAEQVGLLPAGTTGRALAALPATGTPAGRLEVGLTLTEGQLLRLLRIEDPAAGLAGQPALDAESLLGTAAEVIAGVVAQRPPEAGFAGGLEAVRSYLADRAWDIRLGDGPADMIREITPEKYARALGALENFSGTLGAREAERCLDWVKGRRIGVIGCHAECGDGAAERPAPAGGAILHADEGAGGASRPQWGGNEQDGLVDALAAMRRLYFSADLAGARDARAYNELQMEIGRAFKTWFHWSADAGWWLFARRDIRHLTLALFLTLGRLARLNAHAPVLLSAALTLRDAAGRRRIALT